VAKRDPEEAKRKATFGRSTRFCIVQHDALAMVNNRTNEEVVKAQNMVSDELLNSLEDFIRSARAGKLEGRAVLGLACATW
jgi:hypothetical protein